MKNLVAEQTSSDILFFPTQIEQIGTKLAEGRIQNPVKHLG